MRTEDAKGGKYGGWEEREMRKRLIDELEVWLGSWPWFVRTSPTSSACGEVVPRLPGAGGPSEGYRTQRWPVISLSVGRHWFWSRNPLHVTAGWLSSAATGATLGGQAQSCGFESSVAYR